MHKLDSPAIYELFLERDQIRLEESTFGFRIGSFIYITFFKTAIQLLSSNCSLFTWTCNLGNSVINDNIHLEWTERMLSIQYESAKKRGMIKTKQAK